MDSMTLPAAIPARIRLGDLAPDMIRLETEIKQLTHAIRMAAYNAETTLARALDGHYARAGDEAYTPLALDVVRIVDGEVAEIVTFDGSVFPWFGLPEAL